MAIKLIGVEGKKLLDGEQDATTHDFVLVDNPVFFLPDAIAYGRFSSALAKAKGKEPSKLRKSLFFLPTKLRELATLAFSFRFPGGFAGFRLLIKFVSKKIANPLTTRYWSTTPYRLGPRVVKYSAIPSSAEAAMPRASSADYLREAMAAHLLGRDACFDFAVQLQTDKSMPVEDATVEWDEKKSRFITVGRIRIAPQEFNTPERQTYCEHLSFTPWHALPEHQPLGGINRVRRDVYAKLSAARHELNGVPLHEPTIKEF